MAPEPIVRCADALGALYPRPKFRHYLGMLAVVLVFQLFAHWTDWNWLGVVPFILFAAVLLPICLRLGREYHRLVHSLECPHCRRPAGGTFTKQGILHLRCHHCGKETRTDSLVLYHGPPTKV